VDGKECRLVPFRGDQPLWYAYFLVDPTFKWPDFKWATGRTLKVRVEYHQFGSGRFGIDYDGPEGHYTQSRKSISLTGARQWTSAEFQLAGARFGNAQNQKADFRLWTSGSPLFVRRVSVRKEPGVPELEGLIQKGISLAKSNRLVEACQSLSNAIEFFDRKPLSDKYLLIKAVSIRRDLLQRMGRFNEAGADNCRCRNIPPRDAKAKSELLDLSLYYNAALTEDQIGLPGFDLTSLPVGVRKLGNVEFDLRGVVQLCGKGASQRPRDRYPSAVMGIPLNRNFARLHFLVGTEWSEPDSTKIGCLAINYVDGEKRELPLVYGENVRDWNRSADPREAPGASVVWTSENRGVKQSGGFIGLFLVTWDNPRPEVRATSLDFVSNKTQCKPFLIAITAASSVTPDIPEFWLKKAGDLQKQRKVAAAIETLNRGIERCGQDPILHQIRGMLLAETDRLEEAFRSLSAAIDLADALNTPSTFVPEVRLARCGVLKRMNRIAEAGDDYCRAKGYPTRDRKAKFGLVDLSLYYNAALADDFLGGLPGFDLSSLTSGIRDFAGVEFDVRALIQLTGKAVVQRGWTNYPSAVRDIPLPATKINCFHFLLATEWSESEGTKIGAVVINYADGENQELPLTYGEDLRDWFSAEGTRKVSRATVAWIGQTPHSRKHGGFVRLFLSTRDNPRPGAQAKSMDFVSFNTGCSPFLVATTVE
jgi:tetratricopeptide (TPR) repeat protein